MLLFIVLGTVGVLVVGREDMYSREYIEVLEAGVMLGEKARAKGHPSMPCLSK